MYIGTIVREACFKQVLFISTLVASPFDSKGFASRGGRGFLTTVDLSFRTNLYEGFFLSAIHLKGLINPPSQISTISLKSVYIIVYVVK